MWIKVETQIEAQKLAFEIESSDVYQLNTLYHVIKLQDKICNIYILKDMIIIRAEDRDFRHGGRPTSYIKNNRQINNIDAYDWQPKFPPKLSYTPPFPSISPAATRFFGLKCSKRVKKFAFCALTY